MKFLAWNIRFGGIGPGRFDYDPAESPKCVKAVAKAIMSQEADVVVLTEYRDAPETGGVIKAALESRGYQSHVSNPGLDKNGTLMAFSEQVREHYDIHVADNFRIDKGNARRDLLLPLAGPEAGKRQRRRKPRSARHPRAGREDHWTATAS